MRVEQALVPLVSLPRAPALVQALVEGPATSIGRPSTLIPAINPLRAHRQRAMILALSFGFTLWRTSANSRR